MANRVPSEEYPQDLEDAENEILSEDDSSEQPPTDIVAFNELRSCADLVRMYETEQLDIKPDFQRDVVWSNAAQTRFMDSLTKQLPIPSMCISLDYNTGHRLVIDGLQRMTSIIKFLDKKTPWKLSALRDIDARISGKKSDYIRTHYPELFSRVENLTIPITVLRCDYKKSSHMTYLFTIFHRLNTGGNKLSNQEIRNCIYNSPFNTMLGECVEQAEFRHLLGLEPNKGYRFAYEELVLRFFAFVDGFESYDGELAAFLNGYMEKAKKSWGEEELILRKKQFEDTVSFLHDKVMDGAQLPRLSKATIEALLVGVGRNIETLESITKAVARKKLAELRSADEFHPNNLKNALTTKKKLVERMERAVKVFDVK
jgi:hypothetical protein